MRARRGVDPVRIRACLEDRRESRRNLVRAIRTAKALAWKDFLTTIEEDPWRRPYKLVMGKLRARSVPLTEALDPPLLAQIVATLFPGSGRPVAPNVHIREPDDIVVTAKEVCRIAQKIGCGRAPAPDRVPGLVVKKAAVHCSQGLADCFTMLLRGRVFPRAWKKAKLILIKKKFDSSADMPNSYRPICLLDEVGKLFERIVVFRVSEFIESRDVLSPWQHGFRAGFSKLGDIEEVKIYIQECVSNGRVGVLVSLDVSNAFNSLPWEIIIASMEESAFPTYLINVIIKDYLRDRLLSFIGRQGRVHNRRVTC